MTRAAGSALVVSSTVGGVAIALAALALAAEPAIASLDTAAPAPALNRSAQSMPDPDFVPLANDLDTLEQVTSVSQLSDVQPTDWAFQALQSLVERYGCIAGYPDGTFKGNHALSRYEFAAGLNACLDRISELIAAATADLATKDDLAVLQRLQDEFAAELATIRGRVDALEARTAELEANQFSTTTKLQGEVIFAFSNAFGGDSVTNITGNTVDAETEAVFQDRIRLNLVTSFTGRDRLITRLQAGNAVPLLASGGDTGGDDAASLLFSNDGRLTFDDSTVARNGNSVFLDLLAYSFPVGKKLNLHLFANGALHYDYADTLNPYLEDFGGGSGALSRFGERNPIYGLGGDAAGFGLNYQISKVLRLDAGYLANESSDPSSGAGVFNGNYSALGQLVIQPVERFKLGLTYVHAYNGASTPAFRFGGAGTATGTFQANLIPIALSSSTEASFEAVSTPTASNSYGIEAFYQVSDRFAFGGWVGLTKARLIDFGDADIWNYAVTLAFPDLGKEGNLGGIVVGVEPSLKGLRSNNDQVGINHRDDAWHIEGFYKCRVNDNISITPGLIWLPSLNQNSANDDVFIGTIRTTFTF